MAGQKMHAVAGSEPATDGRLRVGVNGGGTARRISVAPGVRTATWLGAVANGAVQHGIDVEVAGDGPQGEIATRVDVGAFVAGIATGNQAEIAAGVDIREDMRGRALGAVAGQAEGVAGAAAALQDQGGGDDVAKNEAGKFARCGEIGALHDQVAADIEIEVAATGGDAGAGVRLGLGVAHETAGSPLVAAGRDLAARQRAVEDIAAHLQGKAAGIDAAGIVDEVTADVDLGGTGDIDAAAGVVGGAGEVGVVAVADDPAALVIQIDAEGDDGVALDQAVVGQRAGRALDAGDAVGTDLTVVEYLAAGDAETLVHMPDAVVGDRAGERERHPACDLEGVLGGGGTAVVAVQGSAEVAKARHPAVEAETGGIQNQVGAGAETAVGVDDGQGLARDVLRR